MRWVSGLAIYLLIGIVYAFTLGMNTVSYWENAGRSEPPRVKTIKWAQLGSNYLTICFNGRLSANSLLRTDFSISVPIEKLNDEVDEYSEISASGTSLSETCENFEGKKILIRKKKLRYSPNMSRVYRNSINHVDGGDGIEIIEVTLVVSNKGNIAKSKEVILYRPNSIKNTFAEIELPKKPTESKSYFNYIGYIFSILIDALTYPFQIVMWFNYVDSH